MQGFLFYFFSYATEIMLIFRMFIFVCSETRRGRSTDDGLVSGGQ